MTQVDIGNPFRLVTSLESFLVAMVTRPEVPKYGSPTPGSTLLVALETRQRQIEHELLKRRGELPQWPEGEDPGTPEPWSGRDEELMTELHRVRHHKEEEWKRLTEDVPQDDVRSAETPTAVSAVEIYGVIQQIREEIAASLCSALENFPRSPTIDRTVVCEALRCLAYGGGIDIDVSSLASLLSVQPTSDDENYDVEALAQALLECVEQRGPAVSDMIRSFLESNNIVRICRDTVVGFDRDSVDMQRLAEPLDALTGDIDGLRRLVLGVVPETINREMTMKQRELLELAEQLVVRMYPIMEPARAPLTSTEIVALAAKYPNSAEYANSVRCLPDIAFTLDGVERIYKSDKEEIAEGYKHGLNKSATIMSGAVLEILLREYLHRNRDRLGTWLNDNSEFAGGRGASATWRRDNLHTWSLDHLIKVASSLAHNKKLSQQWRDLQIARNSVHGRSVDGSIAAFALATVALTVELLFPRS